VLALQTIASRNADPVEQVVVSVTSFETGDEGAQHHPREGEAARHRAHAFARDPRPGRGAHAADRGGHGGTFGATAVLNYKRNYPVTVNSEDRPSSPPRPRARCRAIATPTRPLVMGGEDFAFMWRNAPAPTSSSATARARRSTTPKYDFNDEAIPSHDRAFLTGGWRARRSGSTGARCGAWTGPLTRFEDWRDEIWARGGPRAPQARPQDQGGGALGRRRHQRPAQAQPGPGAGAAGCARRARRDDRARQGGAALSLSAGPKGGKRVIEAKGFRALRRHGPSSRRSTCACCAATGWPSSGRTGRARPRF
jgi:hypothetical protein